MKSVFFGSDEFSMPALQGLLASHHAVLAVVTTPPQPAGRGRKVTPTVVETFSKKKGLPCLAPADLKEPHVAADLMAFGADCFVVVSYGKILPPQLLTVSRHVLNLHPSLLPKYRGPAPIEWALMAGETRLGVSVIEVGRRVDAGAIFKQETCEVDPDADAVQVHEMLAVRGTQALLSVLDELARGTAQPRPQEEALATYARKLMKEDGRITWTRSARELYNQVRALKPWPMAYALRQGMRLIVHRTRVSEAATGGSPGEVVGIGPQGGLNVRTAAGVLELLEVQPEGRGIMTGAAFANGYRVSSGDRFD